jgi:hypothetical protein
MPKARIATAAVLPTIKNRESAGTAGAWARHATESNWTAGTESVADEDCMSFSVEGRDIGEYEEQDRTLSAGGERDWMTPALTRTATANYSANSFEISRESPHQVEPYCPGFACKGQSKPS